MKILLGYVCTAAICMTTAFALSGCDSAEALVDDQCLDDSEQECSVACAPHLVEVSRWRAPPNS